MSREPDPLSVQFEDAAIGFIERAIRRAGRPRVAQRWAVSLVQRIPGQSWERTELAFNRALYRAPQVYHRSDSREWSLKKPVWGAPLGGVREVRIRVFPVRSAYQYVTANPGRRGMQWDAGGRPA
jgi:hypothetical protein